MTGINPTIGANDGEINPASLIQVWGWSSTEAIGWSDSTGMSLFTYIPSVTGSINETANGSAGSINPT